MHEAPAQARVKKTNLKRKTMHTTTNIPELDSKLDRLQALIDTIQPATQAIGRKVSSFTATSKHSVTREHHFATHDAYKARILHFKIFRAVELGLACADPVAETKGMDGTIRRTLWLFMMHCMPDSLEKTATMKEILSVNNACLVSQHAERFITGAIAQGDITDSGFAAKVCDPASLRSFAAAWLSREPGLRARQPHY